MKNCYCKSVILIIFFLSLAGILYSQQLAFPTAEGWGKYTVGGRGGEVYEVTNLNDSGPGSLREAVNAAGPRTVVFRVSGTIELKSDLDIREPYITIAGQTAPGDGICIKKYPIMIRANEIIIRHLRVRLGDESGADSDAISGRYHKNIIIDHVSASWSIDETVSIYHCDSITVQWCLISESLYNANHAKGHHGFGGIWGGPNSSYHHNLIAHHSSRNPRFASGCGNTDFRNNVIYNWGYQSVYGGEQVQEDSEFTFSAVNMVANYYKQGPGTLSDVQYRIVQPSSRNYLADYGKWYITDNYVYGRADVSADNWDKGVQPDHNTQLVKDSIKLDNPALFMPIEQDTAESAYQSVLEKAGAILPRRDTIDKRIIQEVTHGTATFGTGSYNQDEGLGSAPSGIIDSQTDVGGWPALYTGPVPEDRDHDGMPDSWETANGLDPDDPEDRNGIGAGGYTNLEIYLNSIAEFPAFLYAPTNVTAELTGFTRVEITWQDNTEDETGFRIERAKGDTGSFTTAAEVQADVTTYLDTLLEELTLYRYRVMAFNDSLISGYERIVEVTTLSPTSPPTAVSDPSPKDNAVYVATAPTLMWKASLNADSYDVYFGDVNPPPLAINQVEIKYVPGELEKGKKYYWRIDGKNVNGTTEGQVWSFTVKPEIPSGQIVHWKLDETEGTTANDEGDYGLDGELMNMSPSSWTDGIVNGALRFDGMDDYVLVPHSGIIDFGKESFSISAWLWADELTGNSVYLINKGSFSRDDQAGTNGKWFGMEIKNDELRFAIDDDVTKSQVFISGANNLLGEKWSHIVGVRDTTAGILKLYVNGEMLSSVSDGTGSISQDLDLYLGNTTTGTAPLAGILDEVKIFNYALGDAEVKAIYDLVTDVESIRDTDPNAIVLARNYPNPFNASTTITYRLNIPSDVKLGIYNIMGQEIKMLVNQRQAAGEHSVVFDAGNLDSGIYIYRLRVGSSEYRGRMLLLK